MSYLETVDPYEDAGITADELTDKTEVDSQPVDTNEEIAATESLIIIRDLAIRRMLRWVLMLSLCNSNKDYHFPSELQTVRISESTSEVIP